MATIITVLLLAFQRKRDFRCIGGILAAVFSFVGGKSLKTYFLILHESLRIVLWIFLLALITSVTFFNIWLQQSIKSNFLIHISSHINCSPTEVKIISKIDCN